MIRTTKRNGGLIILILLAFLRGRAGDWPTYRRDPGRAASAPERLDPPLAQMWVFTPRHAPAPAWPKHEAE